MISTQGSPIDILQATIGVYYLSGLGPGRSIIVWRIDRSPNRIMNRDDCVYDKLT